MENKTTKKRSKLIYKVLTIIILLGLLIAVSCGIIGSVQFTKVISSMYSNETTQIANIIVDYLNVGDLQNDITMINNAQNTGEEKQVAQEIIYTSAYGDLVRFLDDLRRNIDVTDVYVADFRDKDGNFTPVGTYIAGVSGTRLDPNIAVIGEQIDLSEYSEVISKIYETASSPDQHLRIETDLGPVMNAFVPVTDKKDNVIAVVSVQEPMSKLYTALREYLFYVSFYSILITALVTLFFIYINRKLITEPIKKITEATSNFVENQNSFSAELSTIQTNDEIQTLAESFGKMESDLNTYIDNLQRVTSEKERVQTELNVATDIQKNMLPTIFPAFPDRHEFDIYATMEPAKEVGGDFYDFFLIDEDHLGFVIADVSGKGVPAALFMVITKTLIKDHAQLGETPSEIFTNVNNQLCESNGADLFVTAWLGILEISTGKLTYVNAGHNPPLLKRKDGEYQVLKQRPGLVLAGLEGIKYRQAELDMEVGDKIYLYTDGVTEAQDADETLYGDDRLIEVLNNNSDVDVFKLLPIVREDIQEFVKDADQFDDITMVGLEFKDYGVKPEEEQDSDE